MKPIKAGFLQYAVERDKAKNLEKIKRWVRGSRCDLIVLPELCLSGYLCESREALVQEAEPVPAGPSVAALRELSREENCTLVFGMSELQEGKVYNTAVVVSRGEYVGRYRKTHLSDYEKRFFEEGSPNDLGVFQLEGFTLGVQICFDLWFPEVARGQVRQGADILCALANFGGETSCWMARVRALENQTPLVLCNRIGREVQPGIEADFLGRSALITPSGERMGEAPSNWEGLYAVLVEPAAKRGNVICGDFVREIERHYTSKP